MKALFQLLGAVAAVAAAGLGAAVLAKKLGKECPIKVTVGGAEDAENAEKGRETADKATAAYEAGVPAGKAHAKATRKPAEADPAEAAEDAAESDAPAADEPDQPPQDKEAE